MATHKIDNLAHTCMHIRMTNKEPSALLLLLPLLGDWQVNHAEQITYAAHSMQIKVANSLQSLELISRSHIHLAYGDARNRFLDAKLFSSFFFTHLRLHCISWRRDVTIATCSFGAMQCCCFLLMCA